MRLETETCKEKNRDLWGKAILAACSLEAVFLSPLISQTFVVIKNFYLLWSGVYMGFFQHFIWLVKMERSLAKANFEGNLYRT